MKRLLTIFAALIATVASGTTISTNTPTSSTVASMIASGTSAYAQTSGTAETAGYADAAGTASQLSSGYTWFDAAQSSINLSGFNNDLGSVGTFNIADASDFNVFFENSSFDYAPYQAKCAGYGCDSIVAEKDSNGRDLTTLYGPGCEVDYPDGGPLASIYGLHYIDTSNLLADYQNLYYPDGQNRLADGYNLYYPGGRCRLAEAAGNLYYGNDSMLADVNGNLYYSNGSALADAYGNLYVNGRMLADVSGNLYADYSVIFDSSGTFHGDGSGLYDLPSPFDQSLNTTDNVTFGSIVAQTFSGDGGPLTFANPPASATAPGTVGQIAQDGTYLYLCTAPNTWVRVLISSLFSTW